MTISTSIPTIGTFIEGGYFGGVINVGGTHKGIVWAPKAQGQIKARLLDAGLTVEGAGSPNDCAANTQVLLAAGSPAAQLVAALEINGYSDWLIPSRDVLELGYRHFKPSADENYFSWRDGENSNSVPPGWLYTPECPAQVSNLMFQSGEEEAFDEAWYLTSTVFPAGNTAFIQHFLSGLQYHDYLSSECRVRAVRLIQLGS